MDFYTTLDNATAAICRDAGPHLFDEVALLFDSQTSLEVFVDEGMRFSHFSRFDSVERDAMMRQDIAGQAFSVRFEFLRLPGRSWRIEAMCVLDGDAPLHEALLRRRGSGAVVHLSYKCRSLEEYANEAYWHRERGWQRAAEYRNSYGLFSYWRPLQGDHYVPFVKPRINLRDV